MEIRLLDIDLVEENFLPPPSQPKQSFCWTAVAGDSCSKRVIVFNILLVLTLLGIIVWLAATHLE